MSTPKSPFESYEPPVVHHHCQKNDLSGETNQGGNNNVQTIYTEARDEVSKHIREEYERILGLYIEEHQKLLEDGSTDKTRLTALNTKLSDLTKLISKDNERTKKETEKLLDRAAGDGSPQQAMYRRAKDLTQQNIEIADRQNSFTSSQQRVTHMEEYHRYMRKVFWIYIAVAVLLVGGFTYLYMKAYKSFVAGGKSLGMAMSTMISSGIDSAKTKINEASEKINGATDEENEEVEELSEEVGDEDEE